MQSESIQYAALENLGTAPQVRKEFDQKSMEELAKSIKETGVLQPIRVRKEGDRFIIVDGERRYRAARLAGLATVPVIVEQKSLTESQIAQRQLIANCQREDLTPLEIATAISDLMRTSEGSASQVASMLGFSNAKVTRLLALLSLPDAIRERLQSGEIPASAGYELARISDPVRQAEYAERLANGTLNRDQLAGELKARKRGKQTSAAAGLKRATASLDASRTITVVGDALTLDSMIEALEELLAKARKVRPQGLGLATFLKMLKDQATA